MSGKATESDILAWIEGELPEARTASVEAAFAEDPSLLEWAQSLRTDRAMIRAWADRAVSSAPGGLAQSAIEIVEREALLGPGAAESLAFEPERSAPGMALRVRRYATAAAIVLLVGVVGVTGVRIGTQPGWFGGKTVVRAPVVGDLAMHPEETVSDPHADLLDAVSRARDETNGTALDHSAPDRSAPDRSILEDSTLKAESPSHRNEPAENARVLALATPSSASGILDEELASDRHEGARIRPLSKQTAILALIEKLVGKVAMAGGPAVSITPERASQPDLRDRVVVRVWSDDPEAVVVAMRSLTGAPSSPAVGWHVVADRSHEQSPIDGTVCTVSLPGEASGFAWFVEALTEAGAGRVELTLHDGSAPEPVKIGASDAAGALWWGEPIRAWAGWVRVSVLVSPSEAADPGSASE